MSEIDVYGQLSVSLTGMRDEMRAMRDAATRVPPQPLEMVIRNGAAFPSTGVLGFNMGGPQQGRIWQVRSISVAGTTPTTTEAGRADVFVASTAAAVLAGSPATGSQPGNGGFIFASGLAPASTMAWRDQTTTLPNVAFYGLGDLAVHAGEQLYIVISSGTSTDVLLANMRVDDYETAAYPLSRRS